MSTTQNSGNATNIANFETLIAYCISCGASYNPSRDALKVANLQTHLSLARSALKEYQNAFTINHNATDSRKTTFANLKPLCTKVLGALEISGVDDIVLESAKSIRRKLNGQRASAKPEAVTVDGVTTTPKTHSSSQQSFDYLIEHFNLLISLVSSHSEYNPNEEALKISSLEAFSATLRAANSLVINSNTDLTVARQNRDIIFNAPKTGLVEIGQDVKTYIKTVYGATSVQFLKVRGIAFKKA